MNNLSKSIATPREQSERLLTMGVKPETADCLLQWIIEEDWESYETSAIEGWMDSKLIFTDESIKPAWSLSRLISMFPKCIIVGSKDYMLTTYGDFLSYSHFENGDHKEDLVFVKDKDVFLCLISLIDWLIKNNHFNKEYLK